MKDNIDEIPESHGIGLRLIGKIADELSYTRTDGRRNCLSMIKYFQPVPPQDSTQPWFKRAIDSFKSNFVAPQSDRKSSNQPFQTISLQLNSDIQALAQVLWWVEQF